LGNGLFQGFKNLLLFLTPREFRAFLTQSVEGRRHVGKSGYKFMVKIYHAYEATNASNVAGSSKFVNRTCALGIDATPAGETKCPRKEIFCVAKSSSQT
jgi:hypothetical protein